MVSEPSRQDLATSQTQTPSNEKHRDLMLELTATKSRRAEKMSGSDVKGSKIETVVETIDSNCKMDGRVPIPQPKIFQFSQNVPKSGIVSGGSNRNSGIQMQSVAQQPLARLAQRRESTISQKAQKNPPPTQPKRKAVNKSVVSLGSAGLLDMDKLRSKRVKSVNSVPTSSQCGQNMSSSLPASGPRDGLSDLDKEIASLLNRGSSHAQAAEDEQFNNLQAKIDKIAYREEVRAKENEITSVEIKAAYCTECRFMSEYMRSICKEKGHKIEFVRTTKRYFECNKCRRRENCLGRLQIPRKLCGCGSFDWVPCGKNGSGGSFGGAGQGFIGLRGETAVAAAAEWTSREDKSKISAASASLV
jgi:hypothetical protein